MEWYLIAFISAVLSAFAAISQKKVLFEMDAFDFSVLLSIFNFLFALTLIPIVNFSEISSISLVILYVKTIFGAFGFLLVMLAIKNLEISGALPLMILTPALVAFAAFFILGESLSITNIFGMGTLLFGLYLLETSDSKSLLESIKVFSSSKYKHYLLGAIALFTISSVVDKYLLRDYNLEPITFLFFQQLFLALNFIVFHLLLRKNLSQLLKNIDFKLFSWLVLIALFTIGYRYSLLAAMKLAPVSLVLAIKRTSIFFATIIGGKLFSEHTILRRSIATVLMLAGVYLILNY